MKDLGEVEGEAIGSRGRMRVSRLRLGVTSRARVSVAPPHLVLVVRVCRDGVAIVAAEEDGGAAMDRGDVERRGDVALRGAALSEVGDRTPPVPRQLHHVCSAVCGGHLEVDKPSTRQLPSPLLSQCRLLSPSHLSFPPLSHPSPPLASLNPLPSSPLLPPPLHPSLRRVLPSLISLSTKPAESFIALKVVMEAEVFGF